MSNPQGTGVINPQYYSKMIEQIDAVGNGPGTGACAEIQLIVNQVSATINAQLAAIRAEIAKLLPLITPPSSLGSVITWLGHFSEPLIKQYNDFVADLAATLAQIGELEAAIARAAARLTSCSITIPPML